MFLPLIDNKNKTQVTHSKLQHNKNATKHIMYGNIKIIKTQTKKVYIMKYSALLAAALTSTLSLGVNATSLTLKLHPETDSGYKGDDVTNHSQPKFSAYGAKGMTFDVILNGQTTQHHQTSEETGAVTFQTAHLLDGFYDISIEYPTGTYSFGFVIDTMTTVQFNEAYVNNKKVIFNGSAEPNAMIEVQYFTESGRQQRGATTQASNNGEWSVTMPYIANEPSHNEYSYNVTATDYAGNVAMEYGYTQF